MARIEVGAGDYLKATAPDELVSGGLGPCIVIGAIYGKDGYMLHDPPVGQDYAAVLERTIFPDLRRDVVDKSKLRIYVIGGEIDSNYLEEIKRARGLVLEKIVAEGLEDSVEKIQWCPLGYTQNLKLILSEGRAEIEEVLDEDLRSGDF